MLCSDKEDRKRSGDIQSWPPPNVYTELMGVKMQTQLYTRYHESQEEHVGLGMKNQREL